MRRITPSDLRGFGLNHREIIFVCEYSKCWKPRVAAEIACFHPDHGYTLLKKPEIEAAIDHIQQLRMDQTMIDAEWLLWEAVDNHVIAKQNENINGSNQALNIIAKHVRVDAFAAQKVEMSGDKELADALKKARARLNMDDTASEDAQDDLTDGGDISFL